MFLPKVAVDTIRAQSANSLPVTKYTVQFVYNTANCMNEIACIYIYIANELMCQLSGKEHQITKKQNASDTAVH